MTALPKQMSDGDVAAEIGPPDGYRRPMSCEIHNGTAARSIEFATALAAQTIDTDVDAEIANLALEIDEHPNAFVIRVHRMEKRLAALERQLLPIAGGSSE